ncbi:MAG: type 1 glutamine amidotransferase [Planctomycetaceae bacterium]
MFDRIRYLLLQVRNSGDPMRDHEVRSFARALRTTEDRIRVFDLLAARLARRDFERTDMFLLGGSGEYSAAGEGDWLERALDSLRDVHALGRPTFASCWGFQAMARAMGGRVIHDPARSEIGTRPLHLTDAGRDDPLFGPLGEPFFGQMGHEDSVVELPPGAIRLAYSDRVENQAYRFEDLPIYCTQFHPELRCEDLWERVRTYPEYIENIAGLPLDRFGEMIQECPETEALLPRFVEHVFG